MSSFKKIKKASKYADCKNSGKESLLKYYGVKTERRVDVKKLTGTSDMKKVMDLKGNPLLLFINSWSIGMTLDRNEGLKLAEFSKN